MLSELLHIAWLATPNLRHQGVLVVRLDEPPSNCSVTSVYPARRISKLSKKHIGRTSPLHHMAKHDIRHRLHRRQNKKRLRQIIPKRRHIKLL